MFSAFQTFGRLGAGARAVSAAWSPLALWPDGIATPGMWISPRTLDSQWQDYQGTTPVSVPGTVADTSNPVGLALDIRAGAPEVLGPELAPGGGTFDSATGWNAPAEWSISGGVATHSGDINNLVPSTPILTIGKTYQVQVDILAVPTGFQVATGGNYASGLSLGMNTLRMLCTGDTVLRLQANTGQATVLGSVSVREIPGNHMLQSTSVDRPLLSARVNLLQYTEDFSNVVWVKDKLTQTSGVADPLGGTSAFTLTATSNLSRVYQGATISLVANGKNTQSIWARRRTGTGTVKWHFISVGDGPDIPVTATWTRFDYPDSTASTTAYYGVKIDVSGDAIDVWHPQLNVGPTVLDYQPILTDGSSYTSTGFPIAQLYDGVDDGMATAAFAAGTLINGMDCMIAVRRDSAAATYLISDTGSRGFFEWESGNTNRPDVSAGTPTYYVDGVACTATRGALFTALTAGDWHIVEARNLDLSAWTALEVSSLASYRLNGPRGDILLYPSTASTEDKDAARQWLADYYGVTLP